MKLLLGVCFFRSGRATYDEDGELLLFTQMKYKAKAALGKTRQKELTGQCAYLMLVGVKARLKLLAHMFEGHC